MTCRASFATALLLLMTAGLSTAVASPIEIVFNNTASPGVPFRGPGCCQVGDEVTLGGTARSIVDVSWLIDTAQTDRVSGFETWIYANDGLSGAPGTLLWDSGALIVHVSATDTILDVAVPHVLVPDIITVTSFVFDVPNPAFGSLGRVFGGAPTVGSINASWLEDSPGVWVQQSINPINPGFSVLAEPVPEPSTVWLILSGLVALGGLSRRGAALVGS